LASAEAARIDRLRVSSAVEWLLGSVSWVEDQNQAPDCLRHAGRVPSAGFPSLVLKSPQFQRSVHAMAFLCDLLAAPIDPTDGDEIRRTGSLGPNNGD
jgi:hypothetical protein